LSTAWLLGFRTPGTDLVLLPGRIPGRARCRGPRSDARVRERLEGDRLGAAPGRPRRADAAGLDAVVPFPRRARVVDILELLVHGDRAPPALRVPAPQPCIHPLPEHDPAR